MMEYYILVHSSAEAIGQIYCEVVFDVIYTQYPHLYSEPQIRHTVPCVCILHSPRYFSA